MKCSINLLRAGIRGALEVRLRAKVKNDQPICVYDLAERLGVEVKFCQGKSFGGMYIRSSGTILVPTLRPPGRQAFTCAHELGHWFFGHGSRLDDPDAMEQITDEDPDEQLAHTFASHLLMPSWTIQNVFLKRNVNPENASPLQIYAVASQLGVGYSTLVFHLLYALRLISHAKAEALLRTSPADIRKAVLGTNTVRHLILADRFWSDVPIDIQVGDTAILPTNSKVEGEATKVLAKNETGLLIQGYRPGISRAEVTSMGWASFIRVSKKNYEGRSRYRHLEDPDAD